MAQNSTKPNIYALLIGIDQYRDDIISQWCPVSQHYKAASTTPTPFMGS